MESAVDVAPGDTLLFYTDGVTETLGASERFGEERLLEAMARAGDAPEAMLHEIVRSLREFQSGAAVDDRAMLAMRFAGARAMAAST
jgi:sigma-B regulation protein RsbU (phosphoserine phosphatase)